MLKETTEKIMDKMDNLMDKMVKESMSLYTVSHMDTEEFETVKEALDCWKMCRELAVE
jgi:hypothetical protein